MSMYNLFYKVFKGTRILVVQILLLLFSNCILAQKSNVDIEDNIRSSLDEFVSALSELNHSITTTSINSLFGGANYFCINGNIATFSSFLNNYNSYYGRDNYGDIYWNDCKVNVSNAQGRNVNLSISGGILRKSKMSQETINLNNISSGSTIQARRNPGIQSAPLTASVDAKTVISASSYTFYKRASTTTIIS